MHLLIAVLVLMSVRKAHLSPHYPRDINVQRCTHGKAWTDHVLNHILGPINERRARLRSGDQINGPEGDPLPPAKNMGNVTWSCKLEDMAIQYFISKCAQTTSDMSGNIHLPRNVTGLIFTDDDFHLYEKAIHTWLGEIDKTSMKISSFKQRGKVMYRGQGRLRNYANYKFAVGIHYASAFAFSHLLPYSVCFNRMHVAAAGCGMAFLTALSQIVKLAQQGSFKIGCAQLTCKQPYETLCIIDKYEVDKGQVLYEVNCDEMDEDCAYKLPY